MDDGVMMFQDPEAWQIFNHSYGLDESVIKSIPLFVFRKGEEDAGRFWDGGLECSVCLLEFKELESLRVLPKCSHAFHINCIDVWLRSHANCPLCRANIVVNRSNGSYPFVPVMAARVRPILEHGIAGIVHDSFRSVEENDNEVAQRNSTQGLTESMDVLHEADGEEEFVDVGSNCEDLGAFGKPVLTRFYSFGCSGNEHYGGNGLETLLMAETSASASSPWKRAFKKFNSKGSALFSLRSPFFNRTR